MRSLLRYWLWRPWGCHGKSGCAWIVGNIVATVDVGKERFTYAIIDTVTTKGLSGDGSFKGKEDIERFYSRFQTAIL